MERDVTDLQGMHSLPSSFANNIYIIRTFLNTTFESGLVMLAKYSPETVYPGLSMVSKACVQLSTSPGESPGNTLELLDPANYCVGPDQGHSQR